LYRPSTKKNWISESGYENIRIFGELKRRLPYRILLALGPKSRRLRGIAELLHVRVTSRFSEMPNFSVNFYPSNTDDLLIYR